MTRSVATSPYLAQPHVLEPAKKVSFCTKIKRIWMFACQIVFRDFWSLMKVNFSRIHHCFKANPYNLNPKTLKLNQGVAKIVILMNGAGGHRSCNFPTAKALMEAGVPNVFNKQVRFYNDDAIPTRDLEEEINKIAKLAFTQGAKKVDICLLGHSLGGMIAVKYAWTVIPPLNVTISSIVTLGSRLRFVNFKQPFAWYNIVPEKNFNFADHLNPIYEKMLKDPTKVKMLNIWGDRDALVPKEEAHTELSQQVAVTVHNVGHLGVVNDSNARKFSVEWIKNWSLGVARG